MLDVVSLVAKIDAYGKSYQLDIPVNLIVISRPTAEIKFIMYDSATLFTLPEVVFSSGEFIKSLVSV